MAGTLKLLSEGEYVVTDGHTCYIQCISTSLGFRQYFLLDIDNGEELKRSRYQLEPCIVQDVFVADDNFIDTTATTLAVLDIPDEKKMKQHRTNIFQVFLEKN